MTQALTYSLATVLPSGGEKRRRHSSVLSRVFAPGRNTHFPGNSRTWPNSPLILTVVAGGGYLLSLPHGLGLSCLRAINAVNKIKIQE